MSQVLHGNGMLKDRFSILNRFPSSRRDETG